MSFEWIISIVENNWQMFYEVRIIHYLFLLVVQLLVHLSDFSSELCIP